MFLFAFIVFLAAAVGFFLINYNQPAGVLIPQNIRYVKIAGQEVKVELALTPEIRTAGLSGRDGLKENEGMLFVFSKPGKFSFWMKEMNFPIDIIWLGEDLKVVYIKKDARPESYPESYGLDVNAKYVLEVNADFSEKNNLQVGDPAVFTY
jgi:hypothetical protein